MERLEPFVKEDPAAGWEAWVRYEGSLQCCWTTIETNFILFR